MEKTERVKVPLLYVMDLDDGAGLAEIWVHKRETCLPVYSCGYIFSCKLRV